MNRRTLLAGAALLLVIVAPLGIGLAVTNSRGGSSARDTEPDCRNPCSSPQDPRADVEQAYLRFWDAWIEANENLDTKKLAEVLTGRALTEAEALIAEARAANDPVRVRVTHAYEVRLINPETASVEDTFVDRSVRLNPSSGLETGPPQDKTIRNSYTLTKVEGKWKVAEIIGYRSPFS